MLSCFPLPLSVLQTPGSTWLAGSKVSILEEVLLRGGRAAANQHLRTPRDHCRKPEELGAEGLRTSQRTAFQRESLQHELDFSALLENKSHLWRTGVGCSERESTRAQQPWQSVPGRREAQGPYLLLRTRESNTLGLGWGV